MLVVDSIRAAHGAIEVLHGISLRVHAGEIVTLIGANGAGKTTTLTCISGLHKPKAGKIAFEGKDLLPLPAHQIVTCGIAHCPEGRRVFPRLSVAENLALGAYIRDDKDGIRQDLDKIYGLFPDAVNGLHRLELFEVLLQLGLERSAAHGNLQGRER